MTTVLVSSDHGCRIFHDSGEGETELVGRPIGALASEPNGACIAVVEESKIWRRSPAGVWSQLADTGLPLQSILSVGGTIFGGAMNEAALIRVSLSGKTERLKSFEQVEGRSNWFANGPPLGVRSLAATADDSVLLAAVHVGGIPRSANGGKDWTPTIPIEFDVHEVRGHPLSANIIAAATAVGLCVSRDGGLRWRVFSEGLLETPNSLAVAVLEDEVLFATSDGPFASRSQVWRWRIGDEGLEQIRDGLPEWLESKVDTGGIATGHGRAAILDGGGNLWLSETKSSGWRRIAIDIGYSSGVLICADVPRPLQ